MTERVEDEIDQLYLKSLEERLKRLKDPNSAKNIKTSKFLSDLESVKDQHLFNLLTSSQTFDDDFVEQPQSIEANWVQRKLAPETCAITVEEKKQLVKHDELEAQIRKQLEESVFEALKQEIEAENQGSINNKK